MGEPAPHFTPPRNPQTNDQTTVGHAFGPPHSGILTSMDTPLTGTIDQVTDQALKLARAGNHRARPAHINGKRGILTPHTNADGDLDADDLAAQVYALAHGLTSDDGAYTGGYFTADGLGHHRTAPQPHRPAMPGT